MTEVIRNRPSVAEARALTDRIKVSVETVYDLIIEAFKGEVHLVLGYQNWAEYVETEFPKFQLDAETRKVFVVQMTAAGMSTRAAAAALGVSQMTVVNDLSPASEQKYSVAGDVIALR